VKTPNKRTFVLGIVLICAVAAATQTKLITKASADLGNQSAPPSNGSMSQDIKIVTVKDGDTVKLADGRDIRFCGIDAPETAKKGKPGQPGGEEAKQFLEAMVKRANGEGYLVVTDTDRYGRTVGEIFLRVADAPGGELNANSELIMSGNAWFYRQYSKCPNAQSFETAEEIAKKKRIGVHAGEGFEKPWDFRKRLKG
jgi:micrococcal nuclease